MMRTMIILLRVMNRDGEVSWEGRTEDLAGCAELLLNRAVLLNAGAAYAYGPDGERLVQLYLGNGSLGQLLDAISPSQLWH